MGVRGLIIYEKIPYSKQESKMFYHWNRSHSDPVVPHPSHTHPTCFLTACAKSQHPEHCWKARTAGHCRLPSSRLRSGRLTLSSWQVSAQSINYSIENTVQNDQLCMHPTQELVTAEHLINFRCSALQLYWNLIGRNSSATRSSKTLAV